jgi:hypothetical protein
MYRALRILTGIGTHRLTATKRLGEIRPVDRRRDQKSLVASPDIRPLQPGVLPNGNRHV